MKHWKVIALTGVSFSLLAFGTICGYKALQRHRIAQCLPSGVSFDSPVSMQFLSFPKYDDFYHEICCRLGLDTPRFGRRLATVEETLARVGAYPLDGKLYTPDGQEIVFRMIDGYIGNMRLIDILGIPKDY